MFAALGTAFGIISGLISIGTNVFKLDLSYQQLVSFENLQKPAVTAGPVAGTPMAAAPLCYNDYQLHQWMSTNPRLNATLLHRDMAGCWRYGT